MNKQFDSTELLASHHKMFRYNGSHSGEISQEHVFLQPARHVLAACTVRVQEKKSPISGLSFSIPFYTIFVYTILPAERKTAV